MKFTWKLIETVVFTFAEADLLNLALAVAFLADDFGASIFCRFATGVALSDLPLNSRFPDVFFSIWDSSVYEDRSTKSKIKFRFENNFDQICLHSICLTSVGIFFGNIWFFNNSFFHVQCLLQNALDAIAFGFGQFKLSLWKFVQRNARQHTLDISVIIKVKAIHVLLRWIIVFGQPTNANFWWWFINIVHRLTQKKSALCASHSQKFISENKMFNNLVWNFMEWLKKCDSIDLNLLTCRTVSIYPRLF